MRDILCVGCSHTSYRTLVQQQVIDGIIPDIDDTESGTYSYPEAIHHLYGNKVYNLGMANNSIPSSVLSVISKAKKLLNDGNTNFSIIFQCTDFLREAVYVNKEYRELNGIKKRNSPLLNNYLFTDDITGFWQFGGFQNFNKNLFECDNTAKIGEVYSQYMFNENASTIKSLTHLLLLQNFCKVNNIPYKMFFMMDMFSLAGYNWLVMTGNSYDKIFYDTFIRKEFVEVPVDANIKKDPYVYDLYKMLDLNDIWFYPAHENSRKGVFEWLYQNNEYVEGDEDYIALTIEDIQRYNPKFKLHILNNEPYRLPVSHIKEQIKNREFTLNGHITYYYWKRFVREVMSTWNLF